MHHLPSSVATLALVSIAILAFVAALLLQNWALDLLVGLGSVVAAVVVLSRPGAHA
jgi:hypothetical protein